MNVSGGKDNSTNLGITNLPFHSMNKTFLLPISFPFLVNSLRLWQLDKFGYCSGGEGFLAGPPFLRSRSFKSGRGIIVCFGSEVP